MPSKLWNSPRKSLTTEMKHAKTIRLKLLHPPIPIAITVPAVSFIVLIVVFVNNYSKSMLSYIIYVMSAYSLVVVITTYPKLFKRIKSTIDNSATMKKIAATPLCGRYLNDLSFRGSINIYQGLSINFLYASLHMINGLLSRSAWFISPSLYYLILGLLRVYLAYNYHKCNLDQAALCYLRTAQLLFLLNIPMGGIIILMISKNSGFTYSGFTIYLSALYSFYITIISVVNIVKFKKHGNPILYASQFLNFISALMSILALQPAMIARFSEEGDEYRKLMNTVTGSVVWGIVLLVALHMMMQWQRLAQRPTKHASGVIKSA